MEAQPSWQGKILPFQIQSIQNCNLLRISIQIKIRQYILEIKSKPHPTPFSFTKSKSLNLKFFIQTFRKFKLRRSKNKSIGWFAPHKNYLRGRGNILRNWLWVLLLLVSCSCCIMLKLRYCFSGGGYLWRYLWKLVSNYAAPAPSRFLHQFSKLLFV